MLLFDEYRADRCKIHAERTVYHESVVLKQFVRWCKQRKMLTNNPLEDHRIDKPKREPKGGPSLEQGNLILSQVKEARHLHYALLAFSGMRSGELQHLQRIDVDLAGNWLDIQGHCTSFFYAACGLCLNALIVVSLSRMSGDCT